MLDVSAEGRLHLTNTKLIKETQMTELTARQEGLRMEVSASIISFKERLLNIAQYNIDEIDDDTKSEIFRLLNTEELNRVSDTLLSFTKKDISDG